MSWTPPTATDGSAFNVVPSHRPGESFPVGTTEVTYTFTDSNGLVSVCTFVVRVTFGRYLS